MCFLHYMYMIQFVSVAGEVFSIVRKEIKGIEETVNARY